MVPPSEAFLIELIKALKQKNGNFDVSFSKDRRFQAAYGFFSLDFTDEVSYCYVLDKIELFATPYFRIAENGESTEAVTLYQEDFPITIRNPHPQDADSAPVRHKAFKPVVYRQKDPAGSAPALAGCRQLPR